LALKLLQRLRWVSLRRKIHMAKPS